MKNRGELFVRKTVVVSTRVGNEAVDTDLERVEMLLRLEIFPIVNDMNNARDFWHFWHA